MVLLRNAKESRDDDRQGRTQTSCLCQACRLASLVLPDYSMILANGRKPACLRALRWACQHPCTVRDPLDRKDLRWRPSALRGTNGTSTVPRDLLNLYDLW